MKKTELRKQYRQKRQQLTSETIDDLSLDIANQTLTLPIWDKKTYSIFLSIERQKEINTDFLLNILQGKDKNVALSKSIFKTLEMQHFLLTDNTKIKISSFGIPEPIDGFEVYPPQIDVVFVPLLAFDKSGNRVGYGKGFYDRFLSQCREDVLKIGMSFFEPEEEQISTTENDIALDYCVTPKQVYKF